MLLDNYFVRRRPAFPNAPEPRWAPLATLVLVAGGSAGGYDQELYEAYHYGVNFVVFLLAQAMHAAARSDALLG